MQDLKQNSKQPKLQIAKMPKLQESKWLWTIKMHFEMTLNVQKSQNCTFERAQIAIMGKMGDPKKALKAKMLF